MTVEFPWLSSQDAFLSAMPDDLAAAVLWVGLRDTIDRPLGEMSRDINEVLARMVRVGRLTDFNYGERGWTKWVGEPLGMLLREAVMEGILVAEQRLCLQRLWDHQGGQRVRLLRRGRDAITSGNPYKYVRSG